MQLHVNAGERLNLEKFIRMIVFDCGSGQKRCEWFKRDWVSFCANFEKENVLGKVSIQRSVRLGTLH